MNAHREQNLMKIAVIGGVFVLGMWVMWSFTPATAPLPGSESWYPALRTFIVVIFGGLLAVAVAQSQSL